MPTESGQQKSSFACPGCGRIFPWSDRYAGRRVTCACGRQFLAAVGGGAIDARANDPYDFTGEDPPPRPVPVIPRAPAIAPGSRPPLPMSRPLLSEDDEPAWKWLYVPVLLMAFGFGGRMGAGMKLGYMQTQTQVIGLAVCETVLSVAMMLGGALIAAKVLSINFGSVGRTIMKLTGIALAASAVASGIIAFGGGGRVTGTDLLAVYSVVMLYWIGFHTLFELELQETLLTTAIVGVIQAVGMVALWSSGVT